ncbi:hypothetical protein FF1_000436 [Malus domestica]
MVDNLQNKKQELMKQIEICQEENKILDKMHRQKVAERRKMQTAAWQRLVGQRFLVACDLMVGLSLGREVELWLSLIQRLSWSKGVFGGAQEIEVAESVGCA